MLRQLCSPADHRQEPEPHDVPSQELSWSHQILHPLTQPRGPLLSPLKILSRRFLGPDLSRNGISHHLPTSEEGICCNGKERQLKHKLAKQEGFKPHWGVLQQRVFEFLSVPLQQVPQLQKTKITMNTTSWQGRRSGSNPLEEPHSPAPVAQPAVRDTA